MRSTAKLTYLQQDQYSKIQNCYGTKVAGAYIASQKEAIRLAKEIIETHHIDCDFTKVDSYLFVTQKENLSKLKQEQKGLAQWQKLEDASILPSTLIL